MCLPVKICAIPYIHTPYSWCTHTHAADTDHHVLFDNTLNTSESEKGCNLIFSLKQIFKSATEQELISISNLTSLRAILQLSEQGWRTAGSHMRSWKRRNKVKTKEEKEKERFPDLSSHVSIWSRATFSSSWSKKDSGWKGKKSNFCR